MSDDTAYAPGAHAARVAMLDGASPGFYYLPMWDASAGVNWDIRGWLKKQSDTVAYRLPYEDVVLPTPANFIAQDMAFDQTGKHLVIVKYQQYNENPVNAISGYFGHSTACGTTSPPSVHYPNPISEDASCYVSWTMFPDFFLNKSTGLVDSATKFSGNFIIHISDFPPSTTPYPPAQTILNGLAQWSLHATGQTGIPFLQLASQTTILGTNFTLTALTRINSFDKVEQGWNPAAGNCYQVVTVNHKTWVNLKQVDLATSAILNDYSIDDSSVYTVASGLTGNDNPNVGNGSSAPYGSILITSAKDGSFVWKQTTAGFSAHLEFNAQFFILNDPISHTLTPFLYNQNPPGAGFPPTMTQLFNNSTTVFPQTALPALGTSFTSVPIQMLDDNNLLASPDLNVYAPRMYKYNYNSMTSLWTKTKTESTNTPLDPLFSPSDIIYSPANLFFSADPARFGAVRL